MATNVLEGDVIVRGNLRANTMVLPTNSVGDTQFTSADPLTAAKQVHQYLRTYGQDHGSASAAQRQVIHVAHGAGTLVSFGGGITVACVGDSTITINLYKNGSTILSTTVTITSSNVANAVEEATFSATPYSAGDVFEVVVTVSAGTGTLGQGAFAKLVVTEAAA